jgi:hypothetical protein
MEIAIVVSSCDQYRDAWAPFFYFFRKCWPDCPWPVFLITNHGIYRDPLVTCLPVGRDRSWADNLGTALESIGCDHLLYLQEDYFFTRPVQTSMLREDFEYCRRCDAAYLGLYARPKPDELSFENHPRIGRLAPEARMRVSLQAAVWNARMLRSLMKPGESAWRMERLGSDRSRELLFLRMNSFETSPLDYFFTAIVRGAWEPGAVEMCQQANIALDLRFRPVRPESRWQRTRRKWRFRLERARQRVWPRQFEIGAVPQ